LKDDKCGEISFGYGIAPGSDGGRRAEDVAPTAAVSSAAITCQNVAAVGVDGLEAVGLTEPEGVDEGSMVAPAAGNSAPVAPPALAKKHLTHVVLFCY
jgi:hypothetical protein